MAAPARVTVLVGAGLIVLGTLTYILVVNLQVQAMEEATREQGLAIERQMALMVERVAGRVLSEDGGDLHRFGERLIAALEGNPAVLDLVVVDTDHHVVAARTREPGGQVPCAALIPLDRPMDHEHPAGRLAANPVGCKSVPVFSGGRSRGAVLFHLERDWGAGSERAARWVRTTALRLTPIFLGSYLLLGGLLVAAARALRRARHRAASLERVQALGALADGVNHAIKNPLNAVGLSLQFLARKHAGDAETQEVVATASREAERIREQLDEFVRFTRVSRLETARVALGPRLRGRFPGLEIRGDARAELDAGKIEEALGAVVAFLRGRCSEAEGVHLTLAEGRHDWQVVAEGQACGVRPSDVDRFFDPFVRVPPHDVGPGLALARAIFQAHGGDLVAVLRGTRLALRGHAPRVPPGGGR